MEYDYLVKHCVDSNEEWLRKTNEEIWRVLGIKDLTESSKIIKFYYFKAPFEDAKKDAQRQIIVFINSGHIIIGTSVFDSIGRVESVELQTIRLMDIQKLVLKASANYHDHEVNLEVFTKDGSTICLDSDDANVNWRRPYAEHIREIAQYLLHSI